MYSIVKSSFTSFTISRFVITITIYSSATITFVFCSSLLTRIVLKIWKFWIYVSKKSEKNSYDTYTCFLRAWLFSVQKTSYSELYKNNKILVSIKCVESVRNFSFFPSPKYNEFLYEISGVPAGYVCVLVWIFSEFLDAKKCDF